MAEIANENVQVRETMLVFYSCYNKLLQIELLKAMQIIILALQRSEVQPSRTRLKPRYGRGCIPFWRLQGRIWFLLMQAAGSIQFVEVIRLRSLFPY